MIIIIKLNLQIKQKYHILDVNLFINKNKNKQLTINKLKYNYSIQQT
jgi:hypothetical protein